jgi:hypothetical protein
VNLYVVEKNDLLSNGGSMTFKQLKNMVNNARANLPGSDAVSSSDQDRDFDKDKGKGKRSRRLGVDNNFEIDPCEFKMKKESFNNNA